MGGVSIKDSNSGRFDKVLLLDDPRSLGGLDPEISSLVPTVSIYIRVYVYIYAYIYVCVCVHVCVCV